MKYAIFLIVMPLATLSCASETNTNESETVKKDSVVVDQSIESQSIADDVDNEKFKSLVDAGNGIVIDVRTPEEFAEGHIEGAVNLDFNAGIFESSLDTLDKNVPVMVYCHGGKRSAMAKNKLIENGFKEIYNLVNGYGQYPY